MRRMRQRDLNMRPLGLRRNLEVPSMKLLMNSNISLTPHIGAATSEAQDRIGIELAHQISSILSNA